QFQVVLIFQKAIDPHYPTAEPGETWENHKETLQGFLVVAMTEHEHHGGVRFITEFSAEGGEHVHPVLAPILVVEQAGENHSAQLQLPSAQLPGVLAGGPLIKPMSPAVGLARSQDLLIPTDQMFLSDACGSPGGTAKALALIDLDRAT